MSYAAVLRYARAALYASGYRPGREREHEHTIDSLSYTLKDLNPTVIAVLHKIKKSGIRPSMIPSIPFRKPRLATPSESPSISAPASWRGSKQTTLGCWDKTEPLSRFFISLATSWSHAPSHPRNSMAPHAFSWRGSNI